MSNKIEQNGIITFRYNMYDKLGNLLSDVGPVTMVVGNDTILPGLSNAIIGLDYTIRTQTISFQFYRNNSQFDFELVDLVLEIYEYNNIKVDDQQKQKSNKKNNKEEKNLKKEVNDLQQEVNDLHKEIIALNKNEILLNKKATEIAEKAQDKINEFKESYKKTYELKIQESQDYQFQSFFEKILSPLNNLYMAIEFGANNSANPELVGYVKGFELLVNQIFTILDSYGISPIEPKIGDEFEPELHNAVELISTNKFKSDKIVELRNRGYKLKKRVIIPANVLVSKK